MEKIKKVYDWSKEILNKILKKSLNVDNICDVKIKKLRKKIKKIYHLCSE